MNAKNILLYTKTVRGNRKYIIKPRWFILILSFCFPFLIACKDKPADKNVAYPDTQIEFVHKTFDFGNITEGEIVSHTFYFKNTGTHDFIIRNIESGCGCTTVDYSRKPVKAGKEGKIEIAFNSSGRNGKQYKEISIFANISGQKIVLKFEANVK